MNYFRQICSLFMTKVAIKKSMDCLLDEMHTCHKYFNVRLLICYFNGYYHNYDFLFQIHLDFDYYLDILPNDEYGFKTNNCDVSNYYFNVLSYLIDCIIDVAIYCKEEGHPILC
jgi:hypothetical protein